MLSPPGGISACQSLWPLPSEMSWCLSTQLAMRSSSPRENKGWPSNRKCCFWCSARYRDSFIFHDFFLHLTEAPLSPHWASDSSLYKAQSCSISVIHRLSGSSIIHAWRCWTDWIVTTPVGGSEGGGIEGGKSRTPSSAAERTRRSGGGGQQRLNGSDCDCEHGSDPRPSWPWSLAAWVRGEEL